MSVRPPRARARTSGRRPGSGRSGRRARSQGTGATTARARTPPRRRGRGRTRSEAVAAPDNVVPVAKRLRPIGFLAWKPMIDGGWTIARCDPDDVRALAGALGVSEITASVLARRGHRDPDEARRFVEGALPGHDAFALGDMTEAVEALRICDRRREADLRARRLRRRRHLRHRARRHAPPRGRRGRVVAPAEPLRRGLRPQRARPSRSWPRRASGSC